MSEAKSGSARSSIDHSREGRRRPPVVGAASREKSTAERGSPVSHDHPGFCFAHMGYAHHYALSLSVLRVAAEDARANAATHISRCYCSESRRKGDGHFVPPFDRVVRARLIIGCVELIFDFSLESIAFDFSYGD